MVAHIAHLDLPAVPWDILRDPRTDAERLADHVPRSRNRAEVIARCEDEAAALIDEAEHQRQAMGDSPDSGAHPRCLAPCCLARRRARSQPLGTPELAVLR